MNDYSIYRFEETTEPNNPQDYEDWLAEYREEE